MVVGDSTSSLNGDGVVRELPIPMIDSQRPICHEVRVQFAQANGTDDERRSPDRESIRQGGVKEMIHLHDVNVRKP